VKSEELDVDGIKIERCQGELETNNNTITELNNSTTQQSRRNDTSSRDGKNWQYNLLSLSLFACFLG
jgi:hypothetical protein